MVYDPTSLVTAVYVVPVAGLTSVTFAPGTTAPVESVTIPVIEETSCALTCGNIKARNNTPAVVISLRMGLLFVGRRIRGIRHRRGNPRARFLALFAVKCLVTSDLQAGTKKWNRYYDLLCTVPENSIPSSALSLRRQLHSISERDRHFPPISAAHPGKRRKSPSRKSDSSSQNFCS